MKWRRARRPSFQWPNVAVPPDERHAPLRVRLMWMVGIWAASISVLLIVAIVLRWVLKQTY